MNKKIGVVAALCLIASPGLVAAGELCVDQEKITLVKAGYVDGPLGSYSGNAVYFKTEMGHQYALYTWSNLGVDRGLAMYKALVVAMAGGFKVSATDHHAPYCDDVSEVWIHSD